MPDAHSPHSRRDNECPECREYDFPGYHDLVEQLEALTSERDLAMKAHHEALVAHGYEKQQKHGIEHEKARLQEQLEAVAKERDEYLRQRNHDYARFTEAKQGLIAADSERVRLQEQLETACGLIREWRTASGDDPTPEERAEALRNARMQIADPEAPPSMYARCLDAAESERAELAREVERLTGLLREANYDATDSDGMLPRNPLL